MAAANLDLGRAVGEAIKRVRPDLAVLAEVIEERSRQDEQWGQQDLPDIDPGLLLTDGQFVAILAARTYCLPTAGIAQRDTEAATAAGRLTFAHIAVEELAEAIEAFASGDEAAGRTEVLQLAAVCVQWAQAIDRRRPAATS